MPTPQVPEGGGGCYRDLSSPEISSSSSSYVPPTKGAEGVEVEEEELELGLSLGSNMAARIKCRGGGNGGCGDAMEMAVAVSPSPWGECCRILTAKDFPPIAGSTMALDVSTPSGDGAAVRNKRGACSMAPEAGSNTPSQVVGWPPIRAYRRMNSSFNQTKDSETIQQKKPIGDTGIHGNSAAAAENHEKKEAKSLFVKVKMDGMSIGRKVDLCSHRSYDTLALALEDMFQRPAGSKAPLLRSTKVSSLLDGSSEYVLTYEDKEGDWMLVGDVPWGMFLSTVRRLRIMRTSDANGFEQSFQCSTMAGEAASPSSIRKKGK